MLPNSEARCYLDGEDLHGHVVAQQLRLPHAAEAPPGFHLDQLQRLLAQDGGRG